METLLLQPHFTGDSLSLSTNNKIHTHTHTCVHMCLCVHACACTDPAANVGPLQSTDLSDIKAHYPPQQTDP